MTESTTNVLFTNVWLIELPEPLLAPDIDPLLRTVYVNVGLATDEVNAMDVVLPEQSNVETGVAIEFGNGFTVIE